MADSPFGGERTEPATPRRREEARRRGQVARSVDLTSSLLLIVALVALFYLLPDFMDRLLDLLRYLFATSATTVLQPADAPVFFTTVLLRLGAFFLPLFGILVAIVLLANAAQVGVFFSGEPLVPRFEKINPISGFGRLFSLRAVVELVKSLLKLTVISLIAYYTVKAALVEFMTAGQQDTGQIVVLLGTVAFRVAFRCALALLFIGILDYGFQRYQFEQDIRMTKEEVRQETKDFEGDPLVKARIRRVRRQLAMQRMMAEVPTADVVVTNPTFLAIALQYDMSKMAAPVVVAKGARLQAERIRALATEHNVPIVQNAPLAQTLYKAVEVRQSVPPSLYKAVAEILAFVYQINRRSRAKWAGLEREGAAA